MSAEVSAEELFAEMTVETLLVESLFVEMVPSKFAGLFAEALLSEKIVELAESLPIETIPSSVETIPSRFAGLSAEALFPEMSVEMFLMSVEKLSGSPSHL
jgi:hypothetical protein